MQRAKIMQVRTGGGEFAWIRIKRKHFRRIFCGNFALTFAESQDIIWKVEWRKRKSRYGFALFLRVPGFGCHKGWFYHSYVILHNSITFCPLLGKRTFSYFPHNQFHHDATGANSPSRLSCTFPGHPCPEIAKRIRKIRKF